MTTLEAPSLDVAAIRRDFPILGRSAASGMPLVFLDNAASTQHPRVVIDAMSDCYTNYYANVHRGIHTLSEASTRAYEKAREVVAEFLGASSLREVIFTAGTTAAINTVARTWGDTHLNAGDTILLTIAEHHANIVPWQQLSERTGCRIVFVPLNDQGTIDDTQIADHLERYQPKLFAFVAVSNVLGAEFPVDRWTKMGHQAGATVLVDAAQAAPHRPINVVQWDADFVVFSGHKVCGPNGIGVLYGKEAILEAMPPFLGGGSMIHRVTTEGFEPAELPEKFEAGTPPIVEAIGLAAALKYVMSVGLDAIHRHDQLLAKQAYQGLSEIEGLRILGPSSSLDSTSAPRAGIVSFVIDGTHAHDVAQWLDTQGVAVRAGHHCTMPLHKHLGVSASTRASFYLYNSSDEVETLLAAVRGVRDKFARTGRTRSRKK